MIHFDMTFCAAARCTKANTCERWIENLRVEAKRKNWNLEKRSISVAEFSDHQGNCQHYQPMGNKAKRNDFSN